jgi:hypothetical protein
VEKPFKTNIKITKSHDLFEVYIPQYFLSLSHYLGALFGVSILILTGCFFIGIPLWLIQDAYLHPNKINILGALLFLLIFALIIAIYIACVFSVIDLIIYPQLIKRYLRITEGKITLTKAFIWQKATTFISSVSIQQISRIILTREHFYEDNEGDKLKRQARLEIILTGEITVIKFDNEDRQNALKTNAELAWLAYEVSEWLDKPLTIVEPS